VGGGSLLLPLEESDNSVEALLGAFQRIKNFKKSRMSDWYCNSSSLPHTTLPLDTTTPKKKELMLFFLPDDLLPLIFSFLSPETLCLLDCAILNHTYRPFFLSGLIRSFPKKNVIRTNTWCPQSMFDWYVCRRISVTEIFLIKTISSAEIYSMNSHSLENLVFIEVHLSNELLLAISQCWNLKLLSFSNCSFPPSFEITSIVKNLKHLESFRVNNMMTPLSRQVIESLSRSCPSLMTIDISFVQGMGDIELLCLIRGCPHLRTLSLSGVGITDNSVRMLMNHHPAIPLICIHSCAGVSWENLVSLLRGNTIPRIFNNEDQELQRLALVHLDCFIYSVSSNSPLGENPRILDLLSHNSLLGRLIEFVPTNARLGRWVSLILLELARYGYHRHVVDAGAIPVFVRSSHSSKTPDGHFLMLLEVLSSHPQYHPHLLSAGVLSMFRPSLLDVM
jgi:hypothetical protein